jgi:polyvinyl alcohol dehydrogenase (cytochrome)
LVAALLAVSGVPQLARTLSGSVFAKPLDWGTVDFGDRVLYQLEGSGCVGEQVAVVVGGGGRAEAVGESSAAAADPLQPGACVGIATVPDEAAVRSTGWDDGDPIEIRLESSDDAVTLRYQRVEVDLGQPAAGAPVSETPPVADPRGGANDEAMTMSTGDVVSLGRVDLTNIYSVSVRVCVSAPKPHLTPTIIELRAIAPDAPPILGPIDVADDLNNSNKASFGWPNCWQLQPWPITHKVPTRAPELFLAMVFTESPVHISYLDFNGTGAVKVADKPPVDPEGTEVIFDGTNFDGWTQAGCSIDEDGVVYHPHTTDPVNYAPLATFGFVGESGCGIVYTARQLHNAMVRLEFRYQDFGDNGAIRLGNPEIQMREAGEYLVGGVLGNVIPDAVTNWAVANPGSGYPAERIKSNSYPDWSQMEIFQLGSRYVVRINGRTVTDCIDCAGPDPGPTNLRLSTQPNFSYQYGVEWRMDTGWTNPQMSQPANWGHLTFRNVRVYDCKSLTDPVCLPLPEPGAHGSLGSAALLLWALHRRRSRGPTRRSRLLTAALMAAVVSVGAVPGVARAAEPCTENRHGGEWARYGQDHRGAQQQLAEQFIGVHNVAELQRLWVTEDTGYQSPPPIVSGGCVFINTGGHIEALDLDTGALVWASTEIDTSGTFAVTVVDGLVHASLRNGGRPQAAALDVRTGALVWKSDPITFSDTAGQQSSAVVYDGIRVLFTTGPDFDPEARQGYALFDAKTGQKLFETTTIPLEDIDAGYAGGGVWGTPSVDPESGYLYVGTSNPESKTKEHAYDNAIIKVDLDRDRATFGKIVGSYKGTPDSVTGYDNPVCQSVGDTAWVNAGVYGSSPTCGQLDVDFGNGPTLWRDESGVLLGAATQKSGVLHIFDAETMATVYQEQLWVTQSFLGGMLGRIATDGESLYVPSNPGFVYAIDASDFSRKWTAVAPLTPMRGGNVALANGVAYYHDDVGLYAFHSETGEKLWSSPPQTGESIASGVAVAGHYVVGNHAGVISAYSLLPEPGALGPLGSGVLLLWALYRRSSGGSTRRSRRMTS